MKKLFKFKRPAMAAAPAPGLDTQLSAWQDSRLIEASGLRSRLRAPRRWAIAGAIVGGLLSLVMFAPASWLAHGLASATGGHLLLGDTRGSIWNGSGVLVLAVGPGSADGSALPGRLSWTMGFGDRGLQLRARQDCCVNGELQLTFRPGWGRFEIELSDKTDWIARWPSGWLSGLGVPWNTMQLGGSVRVSASKFRLESAQGRWRQYGQLRFDLVNLSSRISTVAPLGSYQFSVTAESDDPNKPGPTRLRLTTTDGALLLSGEGTVSGGKTRFLGEAQAAPGREAALDNLLNIIGRRQGARSVISIG